MSNAKFQNSKHRFFSSFYHPLPCSLSVFFLGNFYLFFLLFGCPVITAWELSSSLVSMASVYCLTNILSSLEIVLLLLAGS